MNEKTHSHFKCKWVIFYFLIFCCAESESQTRTSGLHKLALSGGTELRKQKGWSQSELAKQIQVSREIVGRYERGDAVPSIDIAKRMADVFEVSLDYLVGTSEKLINKEMLKRIEEVDKMKPEEKKMVYAFLDAFITKTKLQTLL
ncbi:hypothetical protein DF185_22560 [Marinifilum breve]|uniref:HTH cro/C1-type domain-containing protein n=1 Tax=Marinifilum breve TaxID=2184082 RepID=A0A2V3ZTM2_9BACT|nr:helix-turn-helix transcriptional regulator [Marinifilum breve]PXX95164.1 hypothetical protein DF185_22560 [Marinifilum breve]